MKAQSTDLLDVCYPVFAASFGDDSTLVVAGGGGEGRNGIQNKIVCAWLDATTTGQF
jgi:prolactin regulatory element-binding protein